MNKRKKRAMKDRKTCGNSGGYTAIIETSSIRFHYFHTPTYALVSYIIKSLKHFIHLTAPTCFDI
jgi:hypothetical protein